MATITVPTSENRLLLPAALLIVYIVWGSTYLALRFAVEGFPPLLMNGIRFVLAGLLLLWWARWRGRAMPTPRQWVNAGVIGVLLLIGGVGLVTIAEDLGVGSGLVASLVAVMPIWMVLFAWLWGEKPRGLEWIGLLVGLGGIVLLSQEGDFETTTAGLVLVLVAPLFWSFGSVLSTRLDLPKGAMATAAEMLVGGVIMLAVGPLLGERITEMPGLKAWMALIYLISIGGFVAYAAYMYLLEHARAAVASSYAYVNPVVAVFLGVTIGAETVTGWTFMGLPVILAGVGLVGLAQRRV